MKAMIFAAGLGSRLGKLTEDTPKALITAGGKTMLEHVIGRLIAAGVSEVVVNLHYLGKQIEEFIKNKNYFGIKFEFSHEITLLETGGGLKKAAEFFRNEKSFFIYNSDIYCDLDLSKLKESQNSHPALATLVTMNRPTSRHLLFDKKNQLCGWSNKDKEINLGPADADKLAFSGIHLVSPAIFNYMEQQGDKFSIIDTYMLAVKAGEVIRNYNLTSEFWMDMGKPESLQKLREKLGGN